MSSGPLFGILPAGQPLITDPASTPSPTSFLYALPASRPFSHLVVFLLPGVALPAGTAAAIYLTSAADAAAPAPNFRFLGAIGPGKESAMFKVGPGGASSSSNGNGSNNNSNNSNSQAGDLVLGIDVEPEDAVAQRLQDLAASKSTSSGGANGTSASPLAAGGSQPPTVVLAQRIIQNAFNFLASFSGSAGPGGTEVVPLRAFEDWWRKFESRVRADPSFLEKQQSD